MSSALAIAAVTASLKDLLNDGLMDHDLSSIGSFAVTAQPPDRVTTGATENNQLNLFLYQVTANPGWRNVDLPSRGRDGTRLTSPPLALDLHYLLTAYGAQDLNAEVLLGYAMQVLHENPVLTRQQLRTALGAPPPVDGTLLPGPFGTLSAIDLADQVEQIKLTPVYLGSEDLSKLWTAMQARYRPSMAYMVSVVLIQTVGGGRSALPVLKRGADDRGPLVRGAPAPVLTGVRAAPSPLQPALRLGEDLLVNGSNLPGAAVAVRFELPRFAVAQDLPPVAAATAAQLGVHLPSIAEDAAGMDAWAIGVYSVSLRISEPNVPTWGTNSVPMALAPLVTVSPLTGAPGTVNLTLTCTPRLRSEQQAQVRLLFGAIEALPDTVSTPGNPALPTTLTFTIPGVPAGDHAVRLRVDGIDSLPITFSGTPPSFAFDPLQTVVVA
jgi:Pvc16 N-terminal domain